MPYIASSRTSTGGSTGVRPGGGEAVEREAVEGELEQRGRADAVDEPRARDLGAALRVDARELEVVARLEGERRRLADAAELDGVLVGEAVRSARVGRRRDAFEQLGAAPLRGGECLLDLLELGLDALSAPRSAPASASPSASSSRAARRPAGRAPARRGRPPSGRRSPRPRPCAPGRRGRPPARPSPPGCRSCA